MEESKIRKATAAGKFYPSCRKEINNLIATFMHSPLENSALQGGDHDGSVSTPGSDKPRSLDQGSHRLIEEKKNKIDAAACLLPHAGYEYSGKVAAQTVARINIKEKIILLGPNHTGLGAPFSIMTEGIWQTPLGEVKIDSLLAERILKNSKYLKKDILAHAYEHSLEVELPILQYFKKVFEIVPIILLSNNVEILKEIGLQIASVLKDPALKNSTLVIASSDMTHYETQENARKKDTQAIEAILALDEDRLTNRVTQLNISMCGYAPVIVMLKIAKLLGATSAELVRYQTSADTTQDKDSVVGYAGITIY